MSFCRHALACAYVECFYEIFDKIVYEKCLCLLHHRLRSRHECFEVGLLDFLKAHLLDFKQAVDEKKVTDKFFKLCREKGIVIDKIPPVIYSQKYRDWLFRNPHGFHHISNNVFTDTSAWYISDESDLFRIYCLNECIELNPYSYKRSDFLKVWYNKIEYELMKLIWGIIKQKSKRTVPEMFAYFGLCIGGCNCVPVMCSRWKLQCIFNGHGFYGRLMRKEMQSCK